MIRDSDSFWGVISASTWPNWQYNKCSWAISFCCWSWNQIRSTMFLVIRNSAQIISSWSVKMLVFTLQEIQETLLPPSVHIYPKKKDKGLQPQGSNNGVIQANEINSQSPSAIGVTQVEQISNGPVKKSADSPSAIKCGPRSSSPYPNVWSLSLAHI